MDGPARVWVRVALGLLCVVVLVKIAWVADDALITVRSALNFVHGYGATFNIDERVQAYTHPAWFLLVSGLLALVHNPFLVLWTLSFVCALGACVLVAERLGRTFWHGAAGVVLLLMSKAFVDFAVSGLENPLAYLWLAVFALVALRAFATPTGTTLTALAAVVSAIYLTRADLLLIVAPTTAAVAWRHRRHPRRVIGAFALGAVPAVAWTCASMWYYGFPFPNTAYAKLGSGLSTADRLTQGLAYFGDSFHRDRLTIPALGAGVLLGLRTAGLDRTLALGIVAYLSYVAWIGGDFMSGRFLSVPVVAGVILLIRAPLGRVELRIGAAVAAVLASMTLHATLLSGPEYHDKTISAGVADERGFYFQNSGLIARGWTALRLGSADNRLDWVESPRRVLVTCGRLGAAGMTAGPSVHIIDPCGLADPLLARLPPRQDLELRAGHYARLLPTGYMQSVQSRSNEIADPDVRDFYEVLRHITRGPLMDVSRITEVLRVNFGRSDPANRVNARFWSPPKALPISTVSTVVDGGTWNAPGHVVFDRAVIFTLPSQATVHEVDVSLDGNDTYRIEGMVHGRAVEIVAFGPVKVPPPGGGIVRHVHVLPLPLDNVAAIRVTALNGDERYSVGHLIVH